MSSRGSAAKSTVATRLMAPETLPMPLTRIPRIQKSVAGRGRRTFRQRGVGKPADGRAPPVAKLKYASSPPKIVTHKPERI